VGSCLHTQQAGKYISANAAENKDCKEALGFLQSQLLQPVHAAEPQRCCEHRTGVSDGSEGAGRAAAAPAQVGLTCHQASSSGHDFTSHCILPRK